LVLKFDSAELMQFDVVNYSFNALNNGSMAVANFKFQRKIMHHLANTFLPTISLLVIVEFTLFFDESKLEMAVTLSLTVMLVMYTLYQSISLTIPKTAYLKMIDYWLIYCLLTPFVIFIIESWWYLEESKKRKLALNGVHKWTETNDKANETPVLKRKLTKLMVPVATMIFNLAYFGFAIYYFNFP
jgi:hypothetical protein